MRQFLLTALFPVSGACRPLKISSSRLCKVPHCLRMSAFALLALGGVSAHAATYTYDAGASSFPGTLWSNAQNWTGDTLPTFNNQADLVFNTDIKVSGMRIGAAKTVRSMSFGDSLTGGSVATTTIIVQTVLDDGTSASALTLQANTGNATVTQSSGFQGSLLRLGTSGKGNVVLGSSLDLYTHSASKPVQFDSIVSGGGALNKYGVGVAQLYRNNTFSGGINILEGTIEAYSSNASLSTGAVTLGGVSSLNNATLSIGNSVTIANAITVNSGSGTRTISNMAAQAGNATLSGNITLNKDATFAITQNVVSTHDRLTASGTITGTGGMVKTGTGILILSASNNYSGATDIQGGKLYLGTAGRLGSGAVTISSGANLDFGTGSGQTNIVANNISGTGEIMQSTAGTDTRITGDITSTGGLTINAGTVRIGNGTTTGSYNGAATVASGAVLAFARENAYIHGGTISGAGGVTKVNAGDATLNASNSYTGPTTLFTGALVAGHANAFGSTGDIIFRPDGGNSGTIRYTAASAGTDWASRIKNSGGTIRLDTDTNNVTLAGVIDSSNTNGLVKSGAGILTLGGANAYTGATTIGGGTLLVATSGSIASSSATVNSGGLLKVNGTAGAITVNSGGSLSGSGTNGLVTLNRGSLLNPGNSPGTLTAASAIILGGSTYNWEISALTGTPGTTWDLLSVTGLLNMSDVTSTNKWNLVVTGDGFTGWTGTSEYSYVFAQAASVSGFSPTVGTDVTSLFNITASGITSLPNKDFNPNGDFKVVVGSANGLTTLNLMAIPEPSSGSMLGLGLAGLVVTRLLRRKSS